LNKRNIIVYVAGPYRGNISHNIDIARVHAKEIWKAGYTAICPHTNTAYFDNIIEDDEFLIGDIEILKRCDCIYLLPDYWKSSGTKEEIKIALQNLTPIFLFSQNWDKDIYNHFKRKENENKNPDSR
jgi:hypothetical protein